MSRLLRLPSLAQSRCVDGMRPAMKIEQLILQAVPSNCPHSCAVSADEGMKKLQGEADELRQQVL